MTLPGNDSDKSVPADVRIVEISREPVELYKILKFEGMVASGGQGKAVVAAGQVQVNGKVETQKRKKIVSGDTIEFNNNKLGIKLASTVTAEVSPPKTQAEPVAKKQVIEETSDHSVAIDVEKVTANDWLRRVCYILDLNDNEIVALFAHAEQRVTAAQVIAWLKKDDDPDYKECSDTMFATLLNGLINQRRGRKDGPQAKPEESLNNNMIFRKLKIAFDLQAEEILSLLSLADFNISKHELSAFFRRPDHKHYRDCKDQVLRNFLTGLQINYRGASHAQSDEGVPKL